MILGVGIDMIEVERVEASISKGNGFREMIFSEEEIAYCESKTKKFEHYAARFAAKEAFFKALGTGWAKDTLFNEVEVVHDENGKPELQLLGPTAEAVRSLGAGPISVSMSHIKNVASAIVIIEK